MNISMAENAIEPGSQAVMRGAMSRWNIVAFQAVTVSGLDQKTVVSRTMRLMALDTAAAGD